MAVTVQYMSILSRFQKPLSTGSPKWIIAGLGNPGSQYSSSRHNIGFLAMDFISDKLNLPLKSLKFKSLYTIGQINGTSVLLLKPQTFMNLSGESIRDASKFYKIPPERVIVVFDDMSLPVGRLRIRRDGSDGGHNGIKSIIYQLSSNQFPRIKIGIGSPNHSDYDTKDWVLGKFSSQELSQLSPSIELALESIIEIVSSGVDSAMNKFNGKT
ncbi:MAG: aminoacyl-tRNA hydrolase [Clostridiales bacterium]|nr:aminoacyl-tRNA hydrolase [Clostridiales bacterium]